MSRSGFRLTVAVAGLPLLLLVLMIVAPKGWPAMVGAVLLWLIGLLVLDETVWHRSLAPIARLLARQGVGDHEGLRRFVQGLENEVQQANTASGEMGHLLDDISTGLGEGLLVVTPDLRLRLANPRALVFLGTEEVADDAHLLDLERDPDVLDGVRRAVEGEGGHRVLVRNPRGVWEIRPFPLRRGGAVVLITEVGPVRRSAELRRRFVQDLSHELRSPLAVMRTTVEALEDELPADVAPMMNRQVERITRLTDELYELASIEAGEVELSPDEQPVVGVVRQVVADFLAAASANKIELTYKVPEELRCTFDGRALARVLSNLVDNAIKYNRPDGWVKITAREAESAVLFEVADSGVGIPAAELGAVMQRFYRIDRARTPGGSGLGLGLAIVKHMVQQMGGNLTLDSREDVGTRVTVRIPT